MIITFSPSSVPRLSGNGLSTYIEGVVTPKVLLAFAGQSQTRGTGDPAGLSVPNAVYGNAYPNVKYVMKCDGNNDPPVWTEYTIQNLSPVIYPVPGSAVRFGHEMAAAEVLDYSVPLQWGVAKMALDDTTVAANWLYNGTYPTGQIPNLAGQWAAYMLSAASQMAANRIVIIHAHGTSDAGNSGTANAYQTNITNLYSYWRTQFAAAGFGNVPVVVCKINSATDPTVCPFLATVRTAQANYVTSDANSRLVIEDGIALDTDNIHYNANGHVAVGKKIAVGVAQALGMNLRPVSTFTLAANNLVVTCTDTSVDYDGSIAAWHWDFGDNTTSSAQNPVHTFGGAGTYNIALTVTDNLGATDTKTVPITVFASIGGVTRDAASGIYTPANSSEWVTFLNAIGNPVATPNSCWQMQEASGNLADSVGALTLTAAGTPTYQNTVTGTAWTRKAVVIPAGQATRFAMASGTGPNPGTTSQTWVWLGQFIGTPAAARFCAGLSNGTHAFEIGANNVPRAIIQIDGVTTQGTVNPVALNISPICIVHDRTNTSDRMYTLVEEIVGTYSAATNDGLKGWGANGGTSCATECVMGIMWSGANGEITKTNLRLLLQGMGFTIPW